jgi:hypothetical protein
MWPQKENWKYMRVSGLDSLLKDLEHLYEGKAINYFMFRDVYLKF